MQKKKYKGRWERRNIAKAEGVCRFWSPLQSAYAEKMAKEESIAEIQVNVPLDVTEYTSDIICRTVDGVYRVREIVQRKQLAWPSVVKLLDLSRDYWLKRGVEDWGIVINKEISDGT